MIDVNCRLGRPLDHGIIEELQVLGHCAGILREAGGSSAFQDRDHDAGLTTEVCLPAQRAATHAARHRCTWMYETGN
jgi:hypothetical protein